MLWYQRLFKIFVEDYYHPDGSAMERTLALEGVSAWQQTDRGRQRQLLSVAAQHWAAVPLPETYRMALCILLDLSCMIKCGNGNMYRKRPLQLAWGAPPEGWIVIVS